MEKQKKILNKKIIELHKPPHHQPLKFTVKKILQVFIESTLRIFHFSSLYFSAMKMRKNTNKMADRCRKEQTD